MTQTGVLRLGDSKGLAKENAIAELRSAGRPVTSAAIAERIGIHGGATMNQYASTWTQFAYFAKAELGLKNLENVTGQHVLEYLDHKAEIGTGRDHLNTEMAALGKLEQALEKWSEIRSLGKEYDLRGAIETFREDTARAIPANDMIRAYSDPSALVAAVPTGTAANLALKILAESGGRITEGTRIEAAQLRGLATDPHTGKSVGQFSFVGKGGKGNVGSMTPQTYAGLERMINVNGHFEVSKQEVRDALKEAAEATGQAYAGHGAHGLRWNFAADRMQELQEHGMSRDQALAEVSCEMGHNRASITEHYLRR